MILLVLPENPKSQLLGCGIVYLSNPMCTITHGQLRKERGSCRASREKDAEYHRQVQLPADQCVLQSLGLQPP